MRSRTLPFYCDETETNNFCGWFERDTTYLNAKIIFYFLLKFLLKIICDVITYKLLCWLESDNSKKYCIFEIMKGKIIKIKSLIYNVLFASCFSLFTSHLFLLCDRFIFLIFSKVRQSLSRITENKETE